jgi:two-component system, NarL family, response regulator DesR
MREATLDRRSLSERAAQLTPPTLLLAQNDARIETSVLRLLREHFDVVGIVADGAALVEWADRFRPDAVVVDSDLAGLDGLSATTAIHRRFPAIPIVVMTDDADPAFWRTAFGAGAAAFVVKGDVADKLITVVWSLMASELLNESGTLATVPTATGDPPVESLAGEPTHHETARRAMPSLESLVAHVRGEYQEMPGLRLTFAQACRLWQVDAATCETVLERLVREAFLHKTDNGTYIAVPSGARQPAKAHLRERVPLPRSA